MDKKKLVFVLLLGMIGVFLLGYSLVSEAANVFQSQINGTSLYMNDTSGLVINGTTNISGVAYYNNDQICTATNGLCINYNTLYNNIAGNLGNWSKDKPSYLTSASAAGTYQPIGSYLTGEIDPAWTANSTTVCRTDGTNCPTTTAAGGWLNTTTQVYLANNNTNITVGSSTVLFVDNTNSLVGIGTKSPTYPLQVQGGILSNGSANITLRNGASWDAVLSQSAGSNFQIKNGGAIVLTIDSLGRTGINTTIPSQALDVNGSIQERAGTATGIIISGTGSANQKDINFVNDGGSFNWTIRNRGSQNKFYIFSGNGSSSAATPSTPPFMIDSTGKVGIGTDTPTQVLDMKGSINVSGVNSGSIGGLYLTGANQTLFISNASNGCSGVATLSSGKISVSTTCMTGTSSHVLVTDESSGSIANVGSLSVQNRVSGSFSINSTNVLDSSNVYWEVHQVTS